MVNENFCSDKNRVHFWTLFWSKIFAIFAQNQFFGHFLRNRISDLSRTWSETGENCFEPSNGSVLLCLGKFLFWPFWSFLGQKYIACGDIIWFWAFFAIFFQTVDDLLLIFVIGLSASAAEAYGFTLVRPFVRPSHSISRKPRIRF